MKVSVIGATGYTGYELVKILANHPEFKISALVSETNAGQKFSDVYPRLRNICDTEIIGRDYEKVAKMSDAVFLCLPHAAAQDAAAAFHGKGKKVVDFSADFRLKDKELYENTYNVDHIYPDLLESAVYGLPEINGDKIKDATLVANPGCYPTSVITPLYPLVKAGLIELQILSLMRNQALPVQEKRLRYLSLFANATKTSSHTASSNIGIIQRSTISSEISARILMFSLRLT